MSSEAQQPQGGPKTAAGKARSSINALKHGLFSKKVVLACEDQAEFDALLNGYVTEFQPVTSVESDLVREIAASRWRLERVEGIETAIFNSILDHHHEETGDPDPYAGLATAFTPGTDASKSLKLIHLYEGRLRRAYDRALLRLKEHRTAQAAPDPQQQEWGGPPGPRRTPTSGLVAQPAVPAPKPAPAPSSFFQLSDLLKDPAFGTAHLVDPMGKLNVKGSSFLNESLKHLRESEAAAMNPAKAR
jgi:hypothetical protein